MFSKKRIILTTLSIFALFIMFWPSEEDTFILLPLLILLLPALIGFLLVYNSSENSVRSSTFRMGAPIFPVLVLFGTFLLFFTKAIILWTILFPAFLLLAIFGGMLGGSMKLTKIKRQRAES